MPASLVPTGGPRRRADLFGPESPLVRDARYALLLQFIGFLFGAVSSFVEPIAGAIIFASLVLMGGMWSLFVLYMRERSGSTYEVLDNQQLWDLYDPTGQEATHTRRSTIRFLQNDLVAMRDYIWGDGPHIAEDYACNPGRAVDFHKYGHVWHVLISLDEVKHRGDVTEFVATRKMKGSFTDTSEWISFVAQHRTERATVIVLFPRNRPCIKAALTIDMGRTEINNVIEEDYMAGRQRLMVHVPRPRIRQVYTLRWDW
jgi:hypothetical protein